MNCQCQNPKNNEEIKVVKTSKGIKCPKCQNIITHFKCEEIQNKHNKIIKYEI